MVKYFKEVLGETGKIFVSNSSNASVAFKYADETVVSPLIYDKNYIPFMAEYCKKNRIDILIPLFDIDLLVLARHRQEFAKIGTRLIVSDKKIISVCNDKYKTYEFLRDNGFNTPKSFINFDEVLKELAAKKLTYPIVVKPRYGCGSIGVSLAQDEEDLKYLTKKVNADIAESYLKYESDASDEKVIYQECLRGQEYGADIINDLNGNFRSVTVRKKIAMRSGETDIAKIVYDDVITDCLKKLSTVTRHIANMDCDIFTVDGVPYILEMNARFGGGYPFSHTAGCNLPKAIVEWASGSEIDDGILKAKVGTTAFKELYITEI